MSEEKKQIKKPFREERLFLVGSRLLLRIHAYDYHWPVRVLLLSSGWDQVGPRWKCHPKKFLTY
jgi:hypothetical protein